MNKEQIYAIQQSIKLWRQKAYQKDFIIDAYKDLPETALMYHKYIEAREDKQEFLNIAKTLEGLLNGNRGI